MAEVNSTLAFHIHEMSITTKAGKTDVSALFEELNVFDSIYKPCIDGYVVLYDAVGLSSKLAFDGSEKLNIRISKSKDDPDFVYMARSFRIYKQADKDIVNSTSERYKLYFVSEELITSSLSSLSFSYNGTYSDLAFSILINNIGVNPKRMLSFTPSLGVRTIVIPNLKPIEAVQYCSRYALDYFDEKPTFLFFENLAGYNFVSLNELITGNSLGKITYSPKNVVRKEDGGLISDMWSARYLKVLQNYNYLQGIKEGHYAATIQTFDPITGTITSSSSGPQQYLSKTIGDTPANLPKIENIGGGTNFDATGSRIVAYSSFVASSKSEYVKTHDPAFIQKIEPEEKIHIVRKQVFDHLDSKCLKLVLPGNFNITSGFMIDVEVPYFSEKTKNLADNIDKQYSGKYLISAVRHVITYSKHETIFEVVTNSIHEDAVLYASTDEQLRETDP